MEFGLVGAKLCKLVLRISHVLPKVKPLNHSLKKVSSKFEIPDEEPKVGGKTSGRGGKGGKQNMQPVTPLRQQMKLLAAVKAELTELEVTFSDDETLEQLQAKLAQAKE